MVIRASPSALRFSKMHGAGNDFVVLDLRNAPEPSPELCRLLADRHTGVGCDLILGVEAPRSADAIASYRIWTSDGSSSRQCGNGARCIAAWVRRAGISAGPRFMLDSPSGTHVVEVMSETIFRISLGVPEFTPTSIPLTGFETAQDLYATELQGLKVRFAAVSMGNPHAVIEVEDVVTATVAETGKALQGSSHFPQSVNVGFAEIVARDRINLRVYEYGAGETLACGSGACAAAAVFMQQEQIDRSVSVVLSGGCLEIEWDNDDSEIKMTGPVAFVFEGQLDTSHHLSLEAST